MMDVLVAVAASERLSPPRHTLRIETEGECGGRVLDYKPNQHAGTLPPGAIVHLVDKAAQRNSHVPVLSSQTEVSENHIVLFSFSPSSFSFYFLFLLSPPYLSSYPSP
jgi:hypothetical protein